METNAQRWKRKQEEERLKIPEPMRLLEKLATEAISRASLCSEKGSVERALRMGRPIPKRSLPGAMIKERSFEERQILYDLKSDMPSNAEKWVKRWRYLLM